MTTQDVSVVLGELPGRSIKKIRRIMYVFKGIITDRSAGPVEITFADGSILQFNAGPDGEALVVEPAAWIEYFSEPLSAENREFVEKSGKWTAFDVSREVPYSRLIDKLVDEVIPIKTPENKIKGVTIKTQACAVEMNVEADELYVDVG